MSVVIDGTSGLTTPGVVNTAGETIATTLVVTGVTTLTGGLNAALPVLSGGTGVTTKTGTGAVVLGTAPTITGATITVAATAAPAFSAYSTATQNISTTTFTKVTFGTEIFDTNNNFASSRFTPTVAGYYQINATVRPTVSSGAITNAIVAIYKNGSVSKRGTENSSGKTNSQIIIADIYYLDGATDYIEIYGYIEGTSPSFNYTSSDITSYFSAAMIRSA